MSMTLTNVRFQVQGEGELAVPSVEVSWEEEPRLSLKLGADTVAALVEDDAFGLAALPPGALAGFDRGGELTLALAPDIAALALLGAPLDAEALAAALFDTSDPALWSADRFVARELAQVIVPGKLTWRVPVPAPSP